jgi:hypothetical protein
MADPAIVQARAARLATGVVGPIATMNKRMLLGFAVAIVIGFLVGIASREPLVGAAVGFNLLLIGGLVAWWPFFDPTFRGATELFHDHDCHERADWKAKTGTTLPRGLKACETWLAIHPNAPGRASLLLPLGRLDEADQAIDAMRPTSPEDEFAVEILRQTRLLYAGDTPDLTPMHVAWRALPNARERRHRRECLALLDAQVAVDLGADPMAVMAVAREEVDEVHWTMRAPWFIAKWFVLGLLCLVTSALAVAALIR